MGLFKTQPGIYSTMDCIIIIGQSNGLGTNATGTVDATYTNTMASRIFWKPNDLTSANNGTIQNLLAGKNNTWQTSGLTMQGPELSLGYQYNVDMGRPLMIIKYTYSGSYLVDDLSTTRALGIWDVDADATRANNLRHYYIARDNFIIPAIMMNQRNGITLNIKGVSWVQGESDAQTLYCANNYYTKFLQLYDKLITDLTPYGVLSPGIKPIISGLKNDYGYTYASTIATAQTNIAAHYNCPLISPAAYGTEADLIHYSKAAQTQHGLDINTQFKLL